MTIETLTIIRAGDEYSVSGNMSIDEAARALVIIAYQAQPPGTPIKEEESE